MRIPRKKKKKAKKRWFKIYRIKQYIIKSTIYKDGCMVRFKNGII
jgi:hypothetical protein